MGAVTVAGEEHITSYLNDTLTLVPYPPTTLDEADELLALGSKGTQITSGLQLQVRERVEARHRAEEARMAELAARLEREQREYERTHKKVCHEELYCLLGYLSGNFCHDPITGTLAASSHPSCERVEK
jgi:hypothetical protein